MDKSDVTKILTGESKNPIMPIKLPSNELLIVASVYVDAAMAGAV